MPPLPKRRHSTGRGGRRLKQVRQRMKTLIACPHCGAKKLTHVVCPACGKK